MALRNPIRSLADLQQYAVNRKDQVEVVRQSLYDFQQYGTAGATQFTFFSIPIGQSSKTKADTNMTIAGSLPAGQRFAAQSMEVYFFPGVNPSAAGAAAGIDNFVNDTWNFWKATAFLDFFIGSKSYITEAPVMRFPPSARLDGFAGMSDASTAGANLFARTSYASGAGRTYVIDPPVLLESTQNFNVTINYPTAVTVSANARVGVVIGGVLIRNSQ